MDIIIKLARKYAEMIIIVNDKELAIDNNFSVANLIKELGYQDERIAVEVNQAIIAKSKHCATILQGGDKIEIIKAVGGG